MTDLEQFEQWCKAKGHYPAYEAIARFRAYLASRKEHETEALRGHAVKGESE